MSLKIDRKNFLNASLLACAGWTLSACEGDADTGGTGGRGATSTGGTGAGAAGKAAGGAGTGGAGAGGVSAGGGGGAGAGGAGAGGAGAGGAGTSGSSGAGGACDPWASGAGGGGAGGGGASGEAGSTGDDAGAGGDGPGTLTCTAVTVCGTHSHPLDVPGEDVDRGFQAAPYVLEDGGTGHTHTLQLSAYDFLFLAGETPIQAISTETNSHMHDIIISCVRS